MEGFTIWIFVYFLVAIVCTVFGALIGSGLAIHLADGFLMALPEWLSSIGTVSAVFLSLYLLHDKKKIKAQLYSTNSNDAGYKYTWKSDVNVINPGAENYFVIIVSITLKISGENYSYALDAINDSHHPSNTWPKYYVAKAGEDNHLLQLDWSKIYTKLSDNHESIKSNGKDYIRINYVIGNNKHQAIAIYAPEEF